MFFNKHAREREHAISAAVITHLCSRVGCQRLLGRCPPLEERCRLVQDLVCGLFVGVYPRSSKHARVLPRGLMSCNGCEGMLIGEVATCLLRRQRELSLLEMQSSLTKGSSWTNLMSRVDQVW